KNFDVLPSWSCAIGSSSFFFHIFLSGAVAPVCLAEQACRRATASRSGVGGRQAQLVGPQHTSCHQIQCDYAQLPNAESLFFAKSHKIALSRVCSHLFAYARIS